MARAAPSLLGLGPEWSLGAEVVVNSRFLATKLAPNHPVGPANWSGCDAKQWSGGRTGHHDGFISWVSPS